jgi:hypothetical protein
MHRTPSPLKGPLLLLQSGIVVISPNASAISSITNHRVGLVVWTRQLPRALVPETNELLENTFFEHEAVGTPRQATSMIATATEAATPALFSDIEQLARAFSKALSISFVRIRLEYISNVSKPPHEQTSTGPKLVCTYAGMEPSYEDSRGAIRNIPTGHVVVFKDAPRTEPDGSIRSGAIPGTSSNSIVLAIDCPKLN